ncbi:MAG TPA: ABC transporter permease [Gemmatimonadales bacterium]
MNLRITLRSLARRPAYATLVILTLGLGIGAATAIFTVVNVVLLKPLPYHEPDRLAMIWSKWNNFDKTWVAPAEYFDYQRQTRAFQDVGAWADNGEVTVTGDGHVESVASAVVTANLLSVLGVPLQAGRMFTAAEDVVHGPAVVVVGYEIWQRRWGGDPGLVGRTITLDEQPYRVVGILRRDFRLPLEFQARGTAQFITPLRLDPTTPDRGGHYCFAVGRLAPGVAAATASSAVGALAARWTDEGLYPREMRFAPFAIALSDEVSGPVRPALAVLAAAVALLLVLTCANVANLMLTRVESRGREVAVRTALGAGIGELLRLVLAESLALSLAGGALGLLLAWAGVRVLVARAPTTIPRLAELGIDGPVAAFALALAIGASLVFTLMPLWRGARFDLVGALRGGRGQSSGVERRRARSVLVVAETTFAAMLLIGAGLTIRSFIELSHIDLGFDSRNVLTMQFSIPATKYPTVESANAFYHQLGDEVRHIPGVTAAGFARLVPLETEMGDAGLRIQSKPLAPGEPGRQADWQAVSPGYFEAMRVPLIGGRYFDPRDDLNGEQVIIVNAELVKEYFPGESPLGQLIKVGPDSAPWRRVVGVVGDVHHNGVLGAVKRGWYIPQDQWSRSYGRPRRAAYLVVRASGNVGVLAAPILGLVRDLDPDLPATDIQPMSAVVAAATQEQRFTMMLMGAFALLALTLAAVGLYGVISYIVSQRTREIGIRLALGSDVGSVRWLVLRQGMQPALLGVALGLGAAIVLARSLRSVLYGVAPLDGVTFLVAPIVLIVVAAAAVLIPAVRASRVAPIEALQAD